MTHVRVHILGRPTAIGASLFRAYDCDVGRGPFDRMLVRASSSRMHCCGNPRSFKVYCDDADGVLENHALDAAHGAAHAVNGHVKGIVVIAPATAYTQRLVAGGTGDGRLLTTHWARETIPYDSFSCSTSRLGDVRYVQQLHFRVHHRLTIIFEVYRRSELKAPLVHKVYAEYVPCSDVIDTSVVERRLRAAFSDLGVVVGDGPGLLDPV